LHADRALRGRLEQHRQSPEARTPSGHGGVISAADSDETALIFQQREKALTSWLPEERRLECGVDTAG
jgi:hypothetical protein